MGDDEATDDVASDGGAAPSERTCRSMLGIDCVLPLNHEGRHVRQHEHDLRQGDDA